jgi:hypothetical protein
MPIQNYIKRTLVLY